MDILSNIQDLIANPSQPITQEWLDEVQQQYPYFNLPALLYLKQHGIEGNEELLGKLLGSIQSPIANFARVISQIAEKQEEA